MPEIVSVEEAENLVERGVQIIDIRDREAFDRGHVQSAINVPYAGFVGQIKNIELEDSILLVCQRGNRSESAARLLAAYEQTDESTTIYSLANGYSSWDFEGNG